MWLRSWLHPLSLFFCSCCLDDKYSQINVFCTDVVVQPAAPADMDTDDGPCWLAEEDPAEVAYKEEKANMKLVLTFAVTHEDRLIQSAKEPIIFRTWTTRVGRTKKPALSAAFTKWIGPNGLLATSTEECKSCTLINSC